MAYPQFGSMTPQFKSAAGIGTINPFAAAIESATRLREHTTPTPKPQLNVQYTPRSQSVTAPLPFVSASQSASAPPALPQAPSEWGPQSNPGEPGPLPPGQGSAPIGHPPGTPAGGTQELSGYDANGQPIYTLAMGGRSNDDRGVTPNDPNRAQYYRDLANQYNNASSRWHGNITEADVRAFDQYAIALRARPANPNEPVVPVSFWDWMAGGKPQTADDYYSNRAVRFNTYDTPWKGQISRDDVVNFDLYANARERAGLPSIHITEWLNQGKPGAGAVEKQPGSGVFVPKGGWPGQHSNSAPLPGAPSPAAGAPPPAAGAGGGGVGDVGGGTAPPPPFVSGAPPPPAATPPPPALGNFNDSLNNTISEVSARYQPGFQRDRETLQKQLLQTGAVTGALNSGGFTDVVGDEMVNLLGKQSSQLGEEISKQTINASQLAMEKYKTELNDAFQHLQLRTNADLEAKAQELQKYGIDKGDLLERYKAELANKGVMYSADRQVDAAAMQAAAQGAAAAASAAAAKYNADRDYQLGIVNADVTREGNIMNYIDHIASLGSEWAKWIMASDPLGILTGGQIPGDVVIKP